MALVLKEEREGSLPVTRGDRKEEEVSHRSRLAQESRVSLGLSLGQTLGCVSRVDGCPAIRGPSVRTMDSWLWFFHRPLIIPSLGLLQNNSYVMGIFKVSNDARKVIHFK